jgi:hypothetical protein
VVVGRVSVERGVGGAKSRFGGVRCFLEISR